MTKLTFKNVTLRYPVYGSHSMSLRNNIVRIATGGLIEKDTSNVTVITALREINFEISSGDRVGIVGHNGAGKSTLLKTMAGIYKPDIGEVQRIGKVSTVFDIGAGLEPELSGFDNIVSLGMLNGLSKEEAKELIQDVKDFTELGDFMELPVRTYSSGMTLRLMFAVSTAISPDILLLDEMLSTGDESFQMKSKNRIEKLISSAKIVVFASHNKDFIKKYCNRIFSLEHGTLTEIPYETFA